MTSFGFLEGEGVATLLNAVLNAFRIHLIGFVDVLNSCSDVMVGSCVDASKQRHDIKTEFVATVLIFEIRAVVHIGLMHLLQGIDDF